MTLVTPRLFLKRYHEADIFSSVTEWKNTKFDSHIHITFRMSFYKFGDGLTFHAEFPSYKNFISYNPLVYDDKKPQLQL